MAIILASASPRRRELMAQINPDFIIEPSAFDESAVSVQDPAALALALAEGKCGEVAARHPLDTVIGCDTIVACGGAVFGKPKNRQSAVEMLRLLSGRTHAVHTGVCVRRGEAVKSFVATSYVTFFDLGEAEIQRYADTAEPYDKAGAYAIQGRAALWLDRIEGDYYNIVGFPVSRVAAALREIGE